MLLAVVITPIAVGAFAVAGVSIAGASLLPKRGKRRVKPSTDVKIVFMDGSAQTTEQHTVPSTTENRELEVPKDTVAASESESNMEQAAGAQAVVAEKSPAPIAAVEAVERAPQVEPVPAKPDTESQPRRGFGSFLRFGMSRKRDLVTESEPMPVVAPMADEAPSSEVQRPRRKLFSGKAATVHHVEAPRNETVEGDGVRGEDVIAAVETPAGTTSVDARGVIHEQPAEAPFPVERFAENDRVQDVEYASDRERMEAEHRMEMERLAAEQEAFDAEHRRALEAKEAKQRRGIEILETRARLRAEAVQVEAQARASVEAHLAKWWIRLDPDLQTPLEAERIRLAGSLEAIRAPWAAKLICVALEQDESERVRARLIGAYARGYRTESAPFDAALHRSQVERFAVIESLTPFTEEATWIADVVGRASANATAEVSDSPSEHPVQGNTADAEPPEASVIQLPAPAAPPTMSHDTVVAAAS